MPAKSSKPPWKKQSPRKSRGGKSSKLSPELRELARERAAKAGRRYPNLIDNMWAAQRAKASRIDGDA
ncbi:MAG: hypothetical protein G4V63_12250 [Candidatus Afipia apatlaquensis]|uniref:Uncharacterized protein n=1 Tax=Candidatus Afipia apatlaquensis TaxID=2712852 RepID=A0A7C9RG11_9BRAD|nr:hypothetical protein [Candidatus Afipia apatlaquensis]